MRVLAWARALRVVFQEFFFLVEDISAGCCGRPQYNKKSIRSKYRMGEVLGEGGENSDCSTYQILVSDRYIPMSRDYVLFAELNRSTPGVCLAFDEQGVKTSAGLIGSQ